MTTIRLERKAQINILLNKLTQINAKDECLDKTQESDDNKELIIGYVVNQKFLSG